jgi:phosphoribosylformylglycinamidine (FGAM) synthase-like enzyme
LPHPDPTVAWFAESNGRFVCEVAPEHLQRFLDTIDGTATVIGATTTRPGFDTPHWRIDLHELVQAFTREQR